MRRGAIAFLLLLAILLSAAAAGGAAAPFSVKIEGKVLRRASGKLVLSLSEFELWGAREVALRNRRTGETRSVSVSTAYSDIAYTEELPPEVLASFAPDDWTAQVTWLLPDTVDALNDRLNAIHGEQNALRRALGNALLEEGGGGRVSSRLALNKIEKYHRLGAVIAARIRELSRTKEDYNPFHYPIVIQSGFNPFTVLSSASAASPARQVREVLFWEAFRTLTQQLGVEEDLAEFVFDSPATVRRFVAIGNTAGSGNADLVPEVVLSAEAIDAAVYLGRQGFGEHVKKLVRLGMYGDAFIKDRPVLDALVNEGRVIALAGGKAAVTFAPPFMKTGETLFVTVDEKTGEVIPVVLADPRPDEGYTLSAELPPEAAARLRSGMAVRRR